MIRWRPARWSVRHWVLLVVILALSPVVASLSGHPWGQGAALVAWLYVMFRLPVPDLSSWAMNRQAPPAHTHSAEADTDAAEEKFRDECGSLQQDG